MKNNLTDKNKKHALNYNTFCERILNVILNKDSDYFYDILDDFREELLNHCVYWNEKYYITRINNIIKFIANTSIL